VGVPSGWPALPYEAWRETLDTLHAHSQVLGKLAVALAPPEPQLQHAALRLSARGWETNPLPAPDGSGAFVAALDLHEHLALAEHTDGRSYSVPLTPNRPVGEVTRELLEGIRSLAGDVHINATPQEVTWTVPLDEDDEHHTYDSSSVETFHAAATQVALVLAEFRAPYRGRKTPVNAWWGSFDLGVNLFSGESADPPSDDFIMRNSMDAQEVAVGWWPGSERYPKAAFYGYAHPGPEGFGNAQLSPETAQWDGDQGLYLLDWDDAIGAEDPHEAALEFSYSVFDHSCRVCEWDPELAATAQGVPPPVS
jgi:Family of unknown function (DUF5996)